MKFNTTFRGYDKAEVDEYIAEMQRKNDEVLGEQKERIFALVDENEALKEQIKQYKMDEQAIAKSLVESQKLAEELKSDAENFSRIALERAKIFYATWQSYAKTMLGALDDQEMKQFNALAEKIRKLTETFEGGSQDAPDNQPSARKFGEETAATRPSEETMEAEDRKNPIEKVQAASEFAIDLKEILQPEESLEELCAGLGLMKKD